ncbi:MAG: FMN-binding glutamate synthase family protein [Candidatus Adiutrix sp.]|jgi:hypothetical protein|nr:FMN-binding glutamate synthase family protein [Candidatus Adiutrix sp.]
MNQWIKSNDVLGTTNRGTPTEAGLCTLCRADCQGKCETWLSCLAGRETLYPRDFGRITAGSGNVTPVGVSYNALRIMGYHYGSQGAPESAASGDSMFNEVCLETEFGAGDPVRCRYPFMTGALGSTFIAAKYWDSFAAGSALCGIPIVVGENVVGVDRESVFEKGRIKKSPELERRLTSYLRYFEGYGAIIVQLNVEDARNGVAEFLAEKYPGQVIIELKWGQGAKDIGGEIEVSSLDYALFLKERGYLVDPDPSLPEVRKAFEHGAIRGFARHSRLGYLEAGGYEEVRTKFMEQVAHLRALGFGRITLKTGAYGMLALAQALRLATEARLDLLTIDGAGGGTGMSPWDMMEQWGVPSILLHSKAQEYAALLAARGHKVVDLAFGGGLARPSQITKALALGAPYVKMVCMGRAMMIPGFLGSNIEGVLRPANRAKVNGNWDQLPKTVTDIGRTPEEIFNGYHAVEQKLGAEAMKDLPFGAVAMWTLVDKLACGLQQLLAGARKFKVGELSRDDLAAGNRETARETGLTFVTEAQDEVARKILTSR